MQSEIAPMILAGVAATSSANAVFANKTANPFGPDTRTDAEVANRYENSLPANERNRKVNRRRKAIKAKKAARKARKAQRRRK